VINKPPKILVIKSDIAELKKVEDFIINIFNENNLERKYFNKIYLCVSEAVLNSIKHGNKNDLKKNVSIKIGFDTEKFKIQVEDEGDGFDLNKIKDPTKKRNLKNEEGRGIFIITKLSEQIEYNKKGNLVQFNIDCK
jgi:serine/threonine-protein kinase RsbW